MGKDHAQHMIMMVGISGSGKTTYVASNLQDRIHISLDINQDCLTTYKRRELVSRYAQEDPLKLARYSDAPQAAPSLRQKPFVPNPAIAIAIATAAAAIAAAKAAKTRAAPLSIAQSSNNRKAEYIQISDALAAGRSVVVDDTNLTKEIRWPYIRMAHLYGIAVMAVSFDNIPQAITRNKARTGKKRVPDYIMARQCRILEWPKISEGFDHIIKCDA